ncbi:MAG: TIGR02996 domain-containing protein [Planctomycetia bacterium]|nr:TIGR02996 domain-containing protein [Planctomycetia bacterium]
MTFPENRELLAGIIANAADDPPRLIYADWLEEHGDPHLAEFIRVQCGLAAGSPADPGHVDLLERRATVLPRLGRRRMEPPLPETVGFYDNLGDEDDTNDSYYRGLPYFANEPHDIGDEVVAAQRFRDALPKVIATTPLRGVRFHGYFSRQLAIILSSPAAKQLSAISASNSGAGVISRDSLSVQAITASAATQELRWLELDCVDDTADLVALAKTKALGRMERLDIRWLGGEPAAFKRLLGAGWFQRLRRVKLGIAAGHSAANAADAVAALSRLPELHTLTLYDLPIEGARAFGEVGPFQNLGQFFLRHAPLRGEGMAALAQVQMPRLTDLRLHRSKLHNDELAVLCRSELLANLRVLSLEGNEIGDKGVVLLAAHPLATQLRVLNLENNNVGKKGLGILAKAGNFPALTTLNLRAHTKPKLTADDLAQFLATAELPRLRHLDLNSLPVDDAGAKALAANPSFSNLRILSLGYGQIGPTGGQALFASPHLQNLVRLELMSNSMQGKVAALADPKVLPQLAECWLPDDVPAELKSKLRSARDTSFIG